MVLSPEVRVFMIYKIDFLNIMMINIGKIILVLLLFVGCQIGSEYKGKVPDHSHSKYNFSKWGG